MGTVNLVIQCDASEGELGAALLQDGRLLGYAIRALTAAERYYAQIEKELVCNRNATERFHHYTKLPCIKLKVSTCEAELGGMNRVKNVINIFSTYGRGVITKSI